MKINHIPDVMSDFDCEMIEKSTRRTKIMKDKEKLKRKLLSKHEYD